MALTSWSAETGGTFWYHEVDWTISNPAEGIFSYTYICQKCGRRLTGTERESLDYPNYCPTCYNRKRETLTSRNHKTSKAGVITRGVVKALRPLLTALYDPSTWINFDPFRGEFSVTIDWTDGKPTEVCHATISTRSLLYAWQRNHDLSGLLRECMQAILSPEYILSAESGLYSLHRP